MAHKIADRVKETVSSTGTGNFLLTGAVSGFDTFASLLTANGDTTWYGAAKDSEWEIGRCTRVNATTLARTEVKASSNGDALVNFTAPPIVFCTVPAAMLDTMAQQRVNGTLVKWKAAKARGASNPARIAFIGDSNVVGQGTATGTAGLTGAVSTSMTRAFATAGGFQFGSFFGDQNLPSPGVALATYDPRIALGSGWASDAAVSNIVGGRFLVGAAGSVGRVTFTPANSFNKFRVWHPTLAGLNTAMTVYVDGVLTDTFSENVASGYTYRDYTVTAGTHTIGIGVGATNSGYLAGIETFDGTASPVLLQGGFCSGKAADLAAVGNPWNSKPGLVAMVPDFTIINCTINDANAGTATDAYYASLEALIAAVSATSDGCLCVGYPFNGTAATSGKYDDYAQALKNLAADYGWFFYDTRAALGRSYVKATALGYVYDTYHCNAAGASAVAAGLYSFLAANGL